MILPESSDLHNPIHAQHQETQTTSSPHSMHDRRKYGLGLNACQEEQQSKVDAINSIICFDLHHHQPGSFDEWRWYS